MLAIVQDDPEPRLRVGASLIRFVIHGICDDPVDTFVRTAREDPTWFAHAENYARRLLKQLSGEEAGLALLELLETRLPGSSLWKDDIRQRLPQIARDLPADSEMRRRYEAKWSPNGQLFAMAGIEGDPNDPATWQRMIEAIAQGKNGVILFH